MSDPVRCISRIILVTVFICTAFTLTTVLIIISQMPDMPQAGSDNPICSPVHGGRRDPACWRDVNGTREYIIQDIRSAYRRLKEKEEKREKEKESEQYITLEVFTQHYWDMRPSVRLCGTTLNRTSTHYNKVFANNMVSIKDWSSGTDRPTTGFQRYGITIRDGRIVVPVSGIYHIYAYVEMYEPRETTHRVHRLNKRNQWLKQAIFRYNILESKEDNLVTSVQPRLKLKNSFHFNVYSSYISTTVKLKVGDELSLKVNNITLLKYPERNYFGVFMVV